MKNNLDYYRHYTHAHEHPKFKMLRMKYGWAGEGRFWALNNLVALSENCKLDLSKPYVRATIASDLGMETEDFEEYLVYLVEACFLLERDGDTYSNAMLQGHMETVTVQRTRSKAWRMSKMTGHESRNDTESYGIIRNDNVLVKDKKKDKDKDKKKDKETMSGQTPDRIPFKLIISFLNEEIGGDYRHTTATTQSHIRARWREGFTLDDFKKVIVFKASAWKGDPKMGQWLRPQTLFGTKFESYLIEAKKDRVEIKRKSGSGLSDEERKYFEERGEL